MLQLAINYSKGTLSLGDISKKEDISEKYLSQLVIPLKARGFIRSIRGSAGGYILGKVPSEITVKDIVEVFEGDLMPLECINNSSSCNRTNFCATRKIWTLLGNKISEVLNSLTLKDLVEMDGKSKEDFLDYMI